MLVFQTHSLVPSIQCQHQFILLSPSPFCHLSSISHNSSRTFRIRMASRFWRISPRYNQSSEPVYLHSEYPVAENIHIGAGTGLPITHIGSTTLPSFSQSFVLKNVLCVPSMKKNLISVSQFCSNNNVSIEFLPSSFPCEGSSHGGNTNARNDYRWCL